jgi:hydrogenase maturation protein HypF
MNALTLPKVLGCGAWLKNTACLFSHGEVSWSPAHGDLSDPQACRALETSVRSLLGRSARPVHAIAHDLHPDFFSSQLAREVADELGVPAIAVQHHHAHIAAVMAEHSVHEPVIGLALDGVGLGTDGTAWGGELLRVSPLGWQRLGHLWPLSLPGGDVAARQPWRMAAAALHALGRTNEIESRFAAHVGEPLAVGVGHMLLRGLRCPVTSSAGRWFDAAAAALGLCMYQQQEAEAAIALQTAAQTWLTDSGARQDRQHIAHDVDVRSEVLDIRPLLTRLFDDRTNGPEAASAWFHLALGQALAEWAALAAREAGTRIVCLGGGCFANSILTQAVTSNLEQRGLRALLPLANSCGDAGLALGQAWVAAHHLRCAANADSTAAAAAPRSNCLPTESLTCA